MSSETKRILYNLIVLIESLGPEHSITRKEAVERLRRPVPIEDLPSEAVIRHACRFLILSAGVKNAEQVITYRQAAELADVTEDAIQQAVYRKDVISLTVHRDRHEWSGVTLRSLAEWRKWSHERFVEAANRAREFEGGQRD